MKEHLVSLIVLGIMFVSAASAGGAETALQQFNKQQTEAYAKYRVALFQTNNANQEASLEATTEFSQQWSMIIQHYADAPPEVFAADPEWKTTLENIADIAAKAKDEIEAGDVAEAHETLEVIRDELTDLRRRNYVITFSDHINAYHEVMENLLGAKYSPQTLDDRALDTIREQLGVLEYLARRIQDSAPQEYRENQTYEQLEEGLLASIQALRDALDTGSPDEVVTAVRNLKPSYAKLFVRFG